MRYCPAALNTFLAGANYTVVQTDLYTFSLIDGTTHRFTGGNYPLTVPSAAFADPLGLNYGTGGVFTLGPKFGRSKISVKVGVEASSVDIDVYPDPTSDLIGTVTWQEAIVLGFFDGATVELDRLFGSTATDVSLGALMWFYGRVADVTPGRSKISFKVKSLFNLLQIQQMPRRIFGAPCSNRFGDARCGYDRVNGLNGDGSPTGIGQITATATTGSTQTQINATAAIPSTYVLGTLIGLTGANAGVRRTVANNGSGSQIAMLYQLPFPVTVGDTFHVLPGCDLSLTGASGCQVKSNTDRFGGFPYVPPPEAAI